MLGLSLLLYVSCDYSEADCRSLACDLFPIVGDGDAPAALGSETLHSTSLLQHALDTTSSPKSLLMPEVQVLNVIVNNEKP